MSDNEMAVVGLRVVGVGIGLFGALMLGAPFALIGLGVVIVWISSR